MLFVGFVFNWNIQIPWVSIKEEPSIVEQAYKPLLDVLEKYEVKADHFFTGFTDIRLSDCYPQIVDRVLDGVNKKQFEIGTYTYSHPILSLIPYSDMHRQIERGIELDEKTWGFKPKGFLLPELIWDPSLPKVLKENGIEWVAIANTIYKETFPSCGDKELYYPIKVKGIDHAEIPAVQTTHYIQMNEVLRHSIAANGLGIFDKLFQGTSPDILIQSIENVKQLSLKGDNLAVLLKSDSERILTTSILRGLKPEGVKETLETFLVKLKKLPDVKFITIGEYLSKHKPQKSVSLKTVSPHANLEGWIKGSEKTHLTVLESREEIRNAEYIIMLAEKLGANTDKARELLEEAWNNLLLAENSDGIVTSAWKGVYPVLDSISFVYEHALNASELARKAVRKILMGKKR